MFLILGDAKYCVSFRADASEKGKTCGVINNLLVKEVIAWCGKMG
jgi:hypothetical protein